jgi:hypothetical protein
MAGKGPKPVPGFNYKKYRESEYWESVEKKKKQKLKKEKENEQNDSTKK